MKNLRSIYVVTITLLATFNAPGAVRRASTSGTQQPTVSLSTTGLVWIYYPHCINYTYPKTVTLTNEGPGVLDISSITGTNSNFSRTTTCGSTLGAGNSCGITVTWDRISAHGSLVITDNGVGSPQRVSLEGFVLCPN